MIGVLKILKHDLKKKDKKHFLPTRTFKGAIKSTRQPPQPVIFYFKRMRNTTFILTQNTFAN